MTWDEALREAAARLGRGGVEGAARDARLLAAHAAGLPPDRVTLMRGEPMAAEARAALAEAVALRLSGLSVARVTGRALFWGRAFAVTADTLAPRPETETLVALALARPWRRLIDLGTGTGCLAVTLLAERPEATAVATDLSQAALDVAAGNAAAHGVADRLTLQRADWWDGVEGRFDLVVSNPPYIAEAEMAGLSREVLAEPRMALTPGGDGLGPHGAIAAGLAAHLRPGGMALMEIGAGQGAAALRAMAQTGLDGAALHADMGGRDRVVAVPGPEAGDGTVGVMGRKC